MDTVSDFLRGFQASLDSAPMPEEIASVYRPESCLADKPQGSVWLIRRKQDGERFILRTDREQNLREEFDALSRLPESLAGQISEAVSCFEIDGTQYLIRSYLPGRSLAETEVPLPEPQCIRLGAALCRLLDRLHRLSPPIIHRDIKPENVILLPDGTPALIDFGIARSYDPQRDTDTVHMGTRSTAAPEQYGFSQSDQRTDLYSLGVTLRWMLTGSYRPEDLDAADCSAEMKRLLRKAAAFDPADRFPSAADMGAALERLAVPRWKRLLLPAAILAAILSLALAAGVYRQQSLPAQAVDFSSPLLEQAVRMELDIPEGPVTHEDLARIRRLAVVGQEVLRGEQDYQYRLCAYIDGRQQTDAPSGSVSDLSLLSEMPNLNTLYLCNQGIDDISSLAGLPLRELYLCDNSISDLSPLTRLPGLETLYLGSNPITNLTPLAALKSLKRLNLDSWTFPWQVDSLSALAGLDLDFLSIGNIEPADRDWSFLSQLESLDTLWMWDPPEEAATALKDVRSLRSLHLGNYRKMDLSELPVIPGLSELHTYSRLPSLEGVQKQTGLTLVSLCDQPDMDLSPLAELRNLSALYVFECPIRDFSALCRIPNLRDVFLQEANRGDFVRSCPAYGFTVCFS